MVLMREWGEGRRAKPKIQGYTGSVGRSEVPGKKGMSEESEGEDTDHFPRTLRNWHDAHFD